MSLQNKYWVIRACSEQDSAVIDDIPENAPRKYKFFKSRSLLKEYPKDGSVAFSPNYPDRVKLYDFVDNVISMLIVSGKVKGIWDRLGIEKVEYLPLQLLDHNGTPIEKQYYFVNLLVSQPIIDLDKSEYTMGKINKTQMSDISQLYIKLDSVDPDAKLFRAQMYAKLYIMTDEVLQAMKQEGVTGINAFEADGWDGLDI